MGKMEKMVTIVVTPTDMVTDMATDMVTDIIMATDTIIMDTLIHIKSRSGTVN